MLDAICRAHSRANDGLLFAGRQIAWVLVGLMTAVILLQVFMRYVLNHALPWPEEASRYFMIWMAFLVAPTAYRRGAYVSIDTFTSRLKGRTQQVVLLALQLLAMAVLAVMFVESLDFFQRGFRVRAGSFDMKRAWVYLALPVGIGLMISVGVEQIIKHIRGVIDPARFHDASELEHEFVASE